MKNRITTPRGRVLVYQAALSLASLLVVGCSQRQAEPEARLPGPFTALERVEIGGETGVALARHGERWRLDGTPFLVDAQRAESLVRAFQREWQSAEDRPIEHTGEALRVVGRHAVPIAVFPSRAQPVRYTQGRSENDGAGSWVLPEHATEASLVQGAPQLSADPMEWRSDEVLGCDPDAVQAIALSPGPRIVRNGDTWTSESQPVDPYRAEQLARRLCSLDAEPTPAAPAPGEATHRFEVRVGGEPRQLALVEVDSALQLSIDGVAAFAPAESDIEDLQIAHRVLGPTERLALVPERVSRVRIRQGEAGCSATPTESGWAPISEHVLTSDFDRWLRAVSRLNAYHDAPETTLAFLLPRRSVQLETAEATYRVDFVWRDDENVYARIDGGVPFRTQRSAERILRANLFNDQSENSQ